MTPGADGQVPLTALLEETLADLMEEGVILDATLAASEAQRRAIWARREAAAEIMMGSGPTIDTDVSVPLDKVGLFLDRALADLARHDPGARTVTVAHLGDGNLHYSVIATVGRCGAEGTCRRRGRGYRRRPRRQFFLPNMG